MRSRFSQSPILLLVLICALSVGLALFVRSFPSSENSQTGSHPVSEPIPSEVQEQPEIDKTTQSIFEQQQIQVTESQKLPKVPPVVFEFEMEQLSASLDEQLDEMIDSVAVQPDSGELESDFVVSVSHLSEENEAYTSDRKVADDDQQRADPLAGLLEMIESEEPETPPRREEINEREPVQQTPRLIEITDPAPSSQPAVLPTTSSKQPSATPAAIKKPAAKKPKPKTTWTQPTTLTRQIEPLLEVEFAQQWAEETLALIDELTSTTGIDDPGVADLLRQVERQRQELREIADRVAPKTRTRAQFSLIQEMRRIDYRISRRLAVWSVAHQVAFQQSLTDQNESSDVSSFVSASNEKILFDVHPSWREYLLIDEAESVFNSPTSSKSKEKKMARRVLSRTFSPVLTPTQLQYASQALGPDVVEYLRNTATEAPDFSSILKHLETHEEKETGVTSYLLNSHYQNLLWSNDDNFKQLAFQLDTHYRNANVRFAISEELINRMIPQIPSTNEPFAERIKGADVFGQNQIHNQIRVQLIPDPSQIHLNLETQGEVHSVTRALKGGFTVDNQGTTRFQVLKRLAFGRNGVFSDQPVATSSGNQHLVGINSKLDPIPILGRVARRIARQKLEADAPETDRMVRQRVEQSASQRVEEEVENQLNDASTYLQQNVLQPLIAMDLEPNTQQMTTTEEEIVMRYRLAGRDQMGAFTARPRSVRDCLFNVQLHQSAINNMMMRIDLNGRKFTASELVAHFEDLLGVSVNSEIEQKAEFEFAKLDPIRADFKDNEVVISLNLKSFRVGKKGKRWQNLRVSSVYVPNVNGTKIQLVQAKPGLHLKGKKLKLRDQLAIRTIFEALFKEQYEFSAIPEKIATQLKGVNLGISQLVVENGWAGLSVSESNSSANRTGRLFKRRR